MTCPLSHFYSYDSVWEHTYTHVHTQDLFVLFLFYKMGYVGKMMMEGDLTWGWEHIIQYTEDVLWSCTPETYIILLTMSL